MRIKNIFIGVFTTVIFSSTVWAAGFDQELLWSGKQIGMGSAVTSTVEGPEAIFFNPAGMFSNKDAEGDNALVANLGYVRATTKAPVSKDDEQKTSIASNDFIPAILYTRKINNEWIAGVGVYTAGGNNVEYDGTEMLAGSHGKRKIDVKIFEISPSVAYRPNENWSFGLGYRVTYVTAEYSTIIPGANSAINFTDMKGWDFLSARAGAQYKAEKWGAGLTVRSPIKFKVKGDVDASGAGGPFGAGYKGDAEMKATFPLVIQVGGNYKINEHLTLMLDYNFLNYKQTDKLEITTDPENAFLGDKKLDWQNAHLIRLGGQYVWDKTSLRLGYVLATSATVKSTAEAQSEVPTIGHYFTVGGGYAFTKSLELNGSAYYAFSSVHVAGHSDPANPGETVYAGKYSANGLGVHVGANWNF